MYGNERPYFVDFKPFQGSLRGCCRHFLVLSDFYDLYRHEGIEKMAGFRIDKSIGDHQLAIEPPIGHRYEVDGTKLWAHISGSGEPSIVFLPGSGMVGLDYLNIHDQVSEFSTSVLYDRAGTGWSDQVKLPRSAMAVTDELRKLLHTINVPAPYVLVGHSLGGAYARRYAQRFPDDVAGILLLEPAHEDYKDYVPRQTAASKLRGIWSALRMSFNYKAFYRDMFNRMFASWPEEVRQLLIELHLKTLTKTLQEWPSSQRTSNKGLNEELLNGGSMPDVPLIVISCMGIDWSMAAMMSEAYLKSVNDGKRVLYTAFAQSVPHGEYREVQHSGHTTIHIERPDTVVQAIRELAVNGRR